MIPAILFYDFVLAIHIMAIVVAFGVTFAYPILEAYMARASPRAMPAWHRAQVKVGKTLITGGGTIALIAGIYLASKAHYWDRPWVTIPLVILIGLMGLGGAFFGPQEEKAATLAERDIAAAGDGEVKFSAEYEAVSSLIAKVGALASLLVLVAIFFMAAKPGGYG